MHDKILQTSFSNLIHLQETIGSSSSKNTTFQYASSAQSTRWPLQPVTALLSCSISLIASSYVAGKFNKSICGGRNSFLSKLLLEV